jgi:lysophospholipase L1-like esterase
MISGLLRKRRFGRREAAVLITLAVTCLILGVGAERSSAQSGPTRASFAWSLDPRFGLDVDGDGLIEIENTPEYAHNRAPGSCRGDCPPLLLDVAFLATPAAADIGLPDSGFLSYEWRISGPGGTGIYHRTDPELSLLLPEGVHDVDLRVLVRLPWGSVRLRSRGAMEIDDLLVVAIGDSYASGEGSPDIPLRDGTAHWADATDPQVLQNHALTHRSSVGWPARVALALEDRSRASSVTFIDLAGSGARIDSGLLGSRSDPAIAAQLSELERIVQDREIDILLVQIGGNDVGFSRVIRALVEADPLLNPVCYEVLFENVWASANDGIWDRDTRITYSPPFDFGCESVAGTSKVIPGFEGLRGALDRLNRRLDRIPVESVFLVEYPDPTGGEADGEVCDEIVGDVTPPFGFHEVDEQEQAAGVERLLDPLNRSLEEAAESYGWNWVGGVADGFAAGHGYCAPWPDYGYPAEYTESLSLFRDRLDFPEGWYRTPGRYGAPLLLSDEETSWYRTAAQSATLQGPTPRYLTPGTLHPNELGHAAMARLVLAAIANAD